MHSTSRNSPPAIPVIVPMTMTSSQCNWTDSATCAPLMANNASPKASATSNDAPGGLRQRT
ncbi:hypothetical protein D3C83_120730 [compost metagenome]